jgi:hypothetical protein
VNIIYHVFFLNYNIIITLTNQVIFIVKYLCSLLINYYTLPSLLYFSLVLVTFLIHLICVKCNSRVIFFKNQFRHITFYSMPFTILLVLRKRLNFILLIVSWLFLLLSFIGIPWFFYAWILNYTNFIIFYV